MCESCLVQNLGSFYFTTDQFTSFAVVSNCDYRSRSNACMLMTS